MMSLDVSGIDAMQGKLRLLREAARSAALKAAVRAGGAVIQEEMETLAPVLDQKTATSTSLEPGELKENIKLTIAQDKDGFVIATVGPRKYISHVAYWVELGHRLVVGGYSKVLPDGRTRGPGHQRRNTRGELVYVHPHPFLRPAFENSAPRSLEAFTEVLRSKIREVLG